MRVTGAARCWSTRDGGDRVTRNVYLGIVVGVFVGGGVRTPEAVRAARDAGADYVVVGTLLEEHGPKLVRGLAHAART